jgi:hypothetical protein
MPQTANASYKAFDKVWSEGIPPLKQLAFTTHASANTEVAVAHGLGYVPTIFFALPKARCAEAVYWSKAPDATNVYFKCNTTGVAHLAWVG